MPRVGAGDRVGPTGTHRASINTHWRSAGLHPVLVVVVHKAHGLGALAGAELGQDAAGQALVPAWALAGVAATHAAVARVGTLLNGVQEVAAAVVVADAAQLLAISTVRWAVEGGGDAPQPLPNAAGAGVIAAAALAGIAGTNGLCGTVGWSGGAEVGAICKEVVHLRAWDLPRGA